MNRHDVCDFAKHPPGRERVLLYSSFNAAYAPLADIALPNWKAYCEHHGYGLRFYPEEFHLDPTRPETYGDKGKFRLYYDVAGLCDVAVWLDIDSLFMYQPWSIPTRSKFWWTYDENGPNSTLLIAPTDPRTERHLRYAYERAATHSNVRHSAIEPNGISDQDSMRELMNVPPFSQTFGNCVDADEFGLHQRQATARTWIVSFAGLSLPQKLEHMRQYAHV